MPADTLPKYGFYILHENGDTAVGIQTFSLKLHNYTDTVRFSGGIFDSVITRIIYDTVKKETSSTKDWLPALQVGVKVKMDSIPEQSFDSIHVASGGYPVAQVPVPGHHQQQRHQLHLGLSRLPVPDCLADRSQPASSHPRSPTSRPGS